MQGLDFLSSGGQTLTKSGIQSRNKLEEIMSMGGNVRKWSKQSVTLGSFSVNKWVRLPDNLQKSKSLLHHETDLLKTWREKVARNIDATLIRRRAQLYESKAEEPAVFDKTISHTNNSTSSPISIFPKKIHNITDSYITDSPIYNNEGITPSPSPENENDDDNDDDNNDNINGFTPIPTPVIEIENGDNDEDESSDSVESDNTSSVLNQNQKKRRIN